MIESEMGGKTGFRLEKWYLDLVTDDGRVEIFYAARLKWGAFSVPYASRIWYYPAKGSGEEWQFIGGDFPATAGDGLDYPDPVSGARGSWEAGAGPMRQRLFENDEGFLEWKCLRPNSRVALETKNGPLAGRGYAEQLIITTGPWKVPMTGLRWGRFCGGRDSVVWIEMAGEPDRRWVWLNGLAAGEAAVTDEGVTIGEADAELRFSERTVLESEKKIGAVVKNAVGHIPGVSRLLPSRFLLADETKWRSRGTLLVGGEVVDTGWVIHEFVDFGD